MNTPIAHATSEAPRSPIFVTGGSSGIGEAVVRLAAARSIPVAFTYRSHAAEAEALVGELRRQGREVHAFAANFGSEGEVVAAYAELDRFLGNRALGGVVNNAGIGAPHGPISGLIGEALCNLFVVNVVSVVVSSREAVARFRQRRQPGAIVNVSSMAATIGGRPGAAAYAASKAAVDTFSIGLAKEVAAENIRVNVVRPGLTRSRMTSGVSDDPNRLAAAVATLPIGRIAEASEVAKPILWLLSDEASFVTGARLDVSGGGFVVGSA